MKPIDQEFIQSIADGRLVAMATMLSGSKINGEKGSTKDGKIGAKLLIRGDGSTAGTLGGAGLDTAVLEQAMDIIATQKSTRLEIPHEGEMVDIFVDVHAPPPRLIVVGAVHISIHLVTMAKALGFYTIVVDARSAFATPERFPHADRLITQWPADALQELGIDESSMIVVLTHDEKLDNPALEVALRSPAIYIGALGSKKTHAKRVSALQESGATDEEIARIHAPIGLNLGGRKPEEIAVSIIAEIVAVRNGSPVV